MCCLREVLKKDIIVADIEETEEMDASELHARRFNAKEVSLWPKKFDRSWPKFGWPTLAKPTLAKIGVSVFWPFVFSPKKQKNKMKNKSIEERTLFGAPKGGVPKGGRPKISRFFSLSRHHFALFVSLLVSSRGNLVVFEAPGPSNVHVWSSRVEALSPGLGFGSVGFVGSGLNVGLWVFGVWAFLVQKNWPKH